LVLVAVVSCCMTVSVPAFAQSPGFNAIWDPPSTAPVVGGMPNYSVPWWGYIDATPYFYSTNDNDFCATINAIISTSTGVDNSDAIVIDARGVNNPNCSVQTSPWPPNSVPSNGWPNATVLLPAGTIQVSATWQLPQYTRLIGEGPGVTTIQAISGFGGGFPASMIQMGDASCGTDCQGVVIEHLTLNGAGIASYGITNSYAQELSYVNDVALNNITNTGLYLSTEANNSGPYSNIYCSNTNVCAQIVGLRSTRGIHGLTATYSGGSGTVAVYLDSANTTIEDAYIFGYSDGIRIGSQAPAPDNVLINISGVGGAIANLIHISNASSTSSTCPIVVTNSTPDNVCDLTIIAAANNGGTNVIQDDLSNATVVSSTVGLYMLGDQVNGAGASVGRTRYTTSPAGSSDVNLVNWSFGPSNPSSNCTTGSLYSCTGGSSCTHTLWGCSSNAWKKIF
jgi:hypothetical protein